MGFAGFRDETNDYGATSATTCTEKCEVCGLVEGCRLKNDHVYQIYEQCRDWSGTVYERKKRW